MEQENIATQKEGNYSTMQEGSKSTQTYTLEELALIKAKEQVKAEVSAEHLIHIITN